MTEPIPRTPQSAPCPSPFRPPPSAFIPHFSPIVKLNGKFKCGTARGVTVYCHLPAAAAGTSSVKVFVPSFSSRVPSGATTVRRNRAPRSSKPKANCNDRAPRHWYTPVRAWLPLEALSRFRSDRREAAADHGPLHAGVQLRVDRGENQVAEQFQLRPAVLRLVVKGGEDHVAFAEGELHQQGGDLPVVGLRLIAAADIGGDLGLVEGRRLPARPLEFQIDGLAHQLSQARIDHLGVDGLDVAFGAFWRG